MARKVEFKPDKPRTGLLNKLYLTQKQRRALLKWVLYSLVLVFLSVLQDVLLCRMDIFGATTELVPCGIFLICLLEGLETGSVFSLIASCLYLFSGSAAGNHSIVLITAISIFVTFLRQSYLQSGWGAAVLCTLLAMLLYELSVFALGLFFGQTYLRRIGVFALTALLSTVAAPLLYAIFQSIGKIGGQTWKE